MRILVTGVAGFIGMHLTRRLLGEGHDVFGLDGFTDYYDPALKRARYATFSEHPRFAGRETMLEDAAAISRITREFRPDAVFHLAAQAGVRYSLEAPGSYVSSNIVGTFNLLEAVRATPVRHLLIASTSSVYGANPPPFRETDRTDHPLSIYAATKKATEDIAHSYAHLFGQPTTLMRFFTVYGSWYRPDMALYKFARAIFAGEPIDVYNRGKMRRDFIYIDDVVESLVRLVDKPPRAGEDASSSPVAPCRVVNVAGAAPVELEDYIAAIEAAAGRKAIRRDLPMQAGDMVETAANSAVLERLTGFVPKTRIDEGIAVFVEWFRKYHRV